MDDSDLFDEDIDPKSFLPGSDQDKVEEVKFKPEKNPFVREEESGILANNLVNQLKADPIEKIPKKGRKRIISNEEDISSQDQQDMDKQGAPESVYE